MHPLESLEAVQALLDQLMDRPEPFVKALPPSPGSRAERYVQLFCPELHPIHTGGEDGGGARHEPASATRSQSSVAAHDGGAAGVTELRARLDRLEAEVATLRAAVERLMAPRSLTS